MRNPYNQKGGLLLLDGSRRLFTFVAAAAIFLSTCLLLLTVLRGSGYANCGENGTGDSTGVVGSSSSSSSLALRPSDNNNNWPGVPVEELGHALVKKGTTFVDGSRDLFLQYLDEFLQVYEERPDKVNLCGIRINHAYALFLAVKVLQPTAIIESGVNAGQSTYFMRRAASGKSKTSGTKIYCIDPLDEPICGQKERWIDDVNAQYYTGKANFQDIGDVDWASKIKSGELDPSRTLVFLDDHLSVFDRFPPLMKFGFRHVVLEDNYKKGEGATGGDKAGWTPKQMFARVDDDSRYLWNNLASYAEFPPLVSSSLAESRRQFPRKKAGGFLHAQDDNKDVVAPLLRPELDEFDRKLYEDKICKRLGIDPVLADEDSYMQIMNYNQFSYFEIVPMAPRLRSKW